jgi:predicted outer membrane repeat protein
MRFNHPTRRHRNRPAGLLDLECLEDRSVPATFNVTTTLDVVDSGDGKLSLREAITKANTSASADLINVPAGVFKIALAGTGDDGNASGDFDVTGSVTIRGAGAGVTNIDGQQIERVFDIFGASPGSITVVLEKATVRNGISPNQGGGILVANANLVVRDSAVSGNRTSSSGGGISNGFAPGTGDVTLVRTTVSRNFAGGSGGGLNIEGSDGLTVKSSTIRRNAALDGGGIRASDVTVTDSSVSGNSSGNFGGGILALGSATLTNTTVSYNSAVNYGGGINADTATLTRSTVNGNSTSTGAGGIAAITATLTNSTISGNTGGNGGGLIATTATLLNCTVVENIGSIGGGLFHNVGGTFSIRNTIVALNLSGSVNPDVSGNFVSEGHNLIGDGSGSTGFSNGDNGDIVGTAVNPIDPKLGPLANNGGPTKTHALLAGSKAIDGGDNAGALATDQRGFPRKKDGNGDGSSIVDIGAFER